MNLADELGHFRAVHRAHGRLTPMVGELFVMKSPRDFGVSHQDFIQELVRGRANGALVFWSSDNRPHLSG